LTGAEKSRYGFQSQEEDDELKGDGNSLNFEYRMHDPRLGRFFAIDPLTRDYPWNSPYAFSENVLINAIELEGLEQIWTFVYNPETGSFPKKPTSKEVDNRLTKNINVYIYAYPNGGVKSATVKSWDKKVEFKTQGSPIEMIQQRLYSHSQSASISADKTNYDSWDGKGPLPAFEISLALPSITYHGVKVEGGITLRENGYDGSPLFVQSISGSLTTDYSNKPEIGNPSVTFDTYVQQGDDSKPDVSLNVEGQYSFYKVAVSTNTNGEKKVAVGVTLPTKRVSGSVSIDVKIYESEKIMGR